MRRIGLILALAMIIGVWPPQQRANAEPPAPGDDPILVLGDSGDYAKDGVAQTSFWAKVLSLDSGQITDIRPEASFRVVVHIPTGQVINGPYLVTYKSKTGNPVTLRFHVQVTYIKDKDGNEIRTSEYLVTNTTGKSPELPPSTLGAMTMFLASLIRAVRRIGRRSHVKD